jgi:hypothetical protein
MSKQLGLWPTTCLTMRRDNRYRCDGCLRSWREVNGIGPMLNDDVWARICGVYPLDMLCDPCIRARIELVYQRQLRIDDLLPCRLNVFAGYYRELAPPPPRLLADWAHMSLKRR